MGDSDLEDLRRVPAIRGEVALVDVEVVHPLVDEPAFVLIEDLLEGAVRAEPAEASGDRHRSVTLSGPCRPRSLCQQGGQESIVARDRTVAALGNVWASLGPARVARPQTVAAAVALPGDRAIVAPALAGPGPR